MGAAYNASQTNSLFRIYSPQALSPAARRRVTGDWTRAKWIRQDGAVWRLTPSGWLLLDELVLELVAEAAE